MNEYKYQIQTAIIIIFKKKYKLTFWKILETIER